MVSFEVFCIGGNFCFLFFVFVFRFVCWDCVFYWRMEGDGR